MKRLLALVGGLLAVLPLVGCLLMRSFGIPPHATRHEPPAGIEQRALAVGATVRTDFTLPVSDGTTWTLSEHIRHGPAVLVFYRGYW